MKWIPNRVYSSRGPKPNPIRGLPADKVPVFQKDLEILYQNKKSEYRQKLVEAKFFKKQDVPIFNPIAKEREVKMYKEIEDSKTMLDFLEKERKRFKRPPPKLDALS